METKKDLPGQKQFSGFPPMLRVLAALISLIFSLSQVIPYGYADTAPGLNERAVPYVPELSVQAQQNTQPHVTNPPLDATTAFFQTSALGVQSQDAVTNSQATPTATRTFVAQSAVVPVVMPGNEPVTDLGTLHPYPTIAEMEPVDPGVVCQVIEGGECPTVYHNTVTSFSQISSSITQFQYNLNSGAEWDNSRWAGARINMSSAPFNATSQDFVIGLASSIAGIKGGTRDIKLILTSGTGAAEKNVTILLKNVTVRFMTYRVTRTLLNSAGVAGFDASSITSVAIVLDGAGIPSNRSSGTISIKTAGLRYPPGPPDTQVPTGSLTINSGGPYTRSSFVMLYPSAADTGSGIDKMSFSTNGVNWTTPETYIPVKTFTLPSGEGSRTVYVRYYDKAGNESSVYSKSILVDWTAPAGSININSGAQFTNSRTVTLNLLGTDVGSGTYRMNFSTDNVNWTTAEAYATSKTLTLPSGDGTKTVYVKYCDKAGNVSMTYSKSIFVDQTVPTGSININGGVQYTASRSVALYLSGADAGSGIDKMSFSTDGVNWTAAEAYASSKTFTLPAGDGAKTVRVKYFDKAGNVSGVYSYGIILETPTAPDPGLEVIRLALTQKGTDYFDVGVGVDPATHFPYDNMGAGGASPGTYTQPTLIGFYAQILGDVVLGKIDNGMTRAQALGELNTVMTSLISVQSSHGWNGLLPWLNLGPLSASNDTIAVGDNANLAQSLAVMVGALESSGLSGAELTAAQQITGKAEQFLNAQAAGYVAFVDASTGLFRAAYDISASSFSGYIDRVGNEFRGAVAFVAVKYAGVPNTVFENLVLKTNSNYIDRNGEAIENLAPWDGAAFQIFWPMLRNDERGFTGFRDAIYNQLATQLDYAYRNRVPGILSASLRPEGGYYGNIGIPQIAESNMVPGAANTVIGDIGSTYALAAAMQVDCNAVLGWFDAIDAMANMNGSYGFFDSARSSDLSDISQRYIGIDVASTILGLSGNGPADFTAYLRNRGLEAAFNALYNSASQKMGVTRTDLGLASAPEFPDKACPVFSNFTSEGAVLGFPAVATEVYGARFQFTTGAGGGHYWKFNGYNAQANQLIIFYSTVSLPVSLRVEIKKTGGVVYNNTVVPAGNGVHYGRITVDLPDDAAFNGIDELLIMADSAGIFNFTIHSINFQHVLLADNEGLMAGTGSGETAALPGDIFPSQTAAPAEITNPVSSSGNGEVTTTPAEFNLPAEPVLFTDSVPPPLLAKDLKNVPFSIDWNSHQTKPGPAIDLILSKSPSNLFSVPLLSAVEDSRKPEQKSESSGNVDTSQSYYRFLASIGSGGMGSRPSEDRHPCSVQDLVFVADGGNGLLNFK